MSKPLVFMMERTPVFLPVDRRYARNHMWAEESGETLRFGLSAYAVRLAGAIREIEWSVGPGTEVQAGQSMGVLEGSKAVLELYAPLAGGIEKFNLEVLVEPSQLNSDPYAAAWLFEMRTTSIDLLSPAEYLAHVEAGWPLTKRLLARRAK